MQIISLRVCLRAVLPPARLQAGCSVGFATLLYFKFGDRGTSYDDIAWRAVVAPLALAALAQARVGQD